MAEAGEETVAAEEELPEVEIEQGDAAKVATEDAQEVEIKHPDSIEKVIEGPPATDKISEVVIIGKFFKVYI